MEKCFNLQKTLQKTEPQTFRRVFKFVFRSFFLPNCCNITLQDKHSMMERGRKVYGKSVQISIIYFNYLI